MQCAQGEMYSKGENMEKGYMEEGEDKSYGEQEKIFQIEEKTKWVQEETQI